MQWAPVLPDLGASSERTVCWPELNDATFLLELMVHEAEGAGGGARAAHLPTGVVARPRRCRRLIQSDCGCLKHVGVVDAPRLIGAGDHADAQADGDEINMQIRQ